MKKIIISSREYAKICLECPRKVCRPQNCDRLRPYKVSEGGRKNAEKESDK